MTATFVDIDDDTLQAAVALWKRTPALQGEIGELRAGDLQGDLPARYAAVQCTKGKDSQRMTGGAYHDYRQVEISVYGRKADASAGLKAVLAVFNRLCTLDLPSGARFVQWWPLNDGELVREGGRRKGEEMWRGVVKGQVWTVRVDA